MFKQWFFQIMYIVSFNFKLNGVEAESIILKQFSVLSDGFSKLCT